MIDDHGDDDDDDEDDHDHDHDDGGHDHVSSVTMPNFTPSRHIY